MGEFHLRSIVAAVVAVDGTQGWSFTEDDTWCHVCPPDGTAVARVQGWKLHVSATRLSVPEVLHRCAGVLVERACAFKFARTAELVAKLTNERYDRAQCGKIITVYPEDDDQLREVAAALDATTAGMRGPAVLSDRPLRPGSLVHYRYGAFQGVRVLTDDGAYQVRLRTPDGRTIEDVRAPRFSPPPWAEPPYPAPAAPPASNGAAGARTVVLGDRFEVREAIRHAARGGVYRAWDRHTETMVIVKQARADVGQRPDGRDARDVLRAEADALDALAGIAPDRLALFDQKDHTFLAESLVPGTTLSAWIHDRLTAAGPMAGPAPADALDMASRLAGLLAEVHRRGLVFQDFTPMNIMVTPDGSLRLIDPELVAVPGAWALRGHTPAFAPPETVDEIGPGRVPQQSADLYALGAVLFVLALGAAPLFGTDQPGPGSTHDRITALITAAAVHNATARALAPAIRGLTADEPAQRWSIERLRAFLDDRAATPTTVLRTGPAEGTTSDRLPAAELDSFARDGLTHIVSTVASEPDAGRLWSSTAFGTTADPHSVQHGSAGVLSVLVRADQLLDRPDLRAVIARVAAWTGRPGTAPRLLPGLYFGRSGTAWALYDAARHLGDADLEARAVDLALALPVRWPNPDVCHGVAGSALAQLRLWRGTGREEFLDRARQAGEALLAGATEADGRVYWTVPDNLDSTLVGITHLGFAHGVAGIGYTLLALAQATGREDFLRTAVLAGDTLAVEVDRKPWGAGWRSDRGDERGTGMQFHWCSGSSGVGTFLLRLWQATGEITYLDLAREAAAAVRQTRWRTGTSACHGLAGNGEFLLDLADAVGGEYRAWAQELATSMVLRHARHGDLRLVPDEGDQDVTADFNVGLAGSVGFLLRLRHGGRRPFMADPSSGRWQVAPASARRPVAAR
ncbi:Serine/threonine protein kinase [Actinoplanes sp. SE50]|uniref:class IV lanthionine synthetase LanL n=1 Tax=unclassified Actinoplanes TaxID=2626549 RepID=UPI00023ECB58|nr:MULTISPECIES: class IV lanthionine synthetase LanL [unclassified Actinoplanes]AEV85426.1 Serine/threonine protein kinase [Actinoplanes sp. SE50/110]ATO83821.1 Serine/threonine protein kinase [Actinoplanes sp. SE50]SLM01229.1 serine/threonine protein kinase [Actinoplanes sp. SE50/110]